MIIDGSMKVAALINLNQDLQALYLLLGLPDWAINRGKKRIHRNTGARIDRSSPRSAG